MSDGVPIDVIKDDGVEITHDDKDVVFINGEKILTEKHVAYSPEIVEIITNSRSNARHQFKKKVKLYAFTRFSRGRWLYLFLVSSKLRKIAINTDVVLIDGRLYPNTPELVKFEKGRFITTELVNSDPDSFCVTILCSRFDLFNFGSYVKSSDTNHPAIKDVTIGKLSQAGLEKYLSKRLGKGGTPPGGPGYLTLGEYINKLREERGLSQEKLAELSGVSDKTIWTIESNDNYQPKIETLVAICLALQLEEEEVKTLFKLAGRTFRNTERDQTLRYFLKINTAPEDGGEKEWLTVHTCNSFLEILGLKPLNKE